MTDTKFSGIADVLVVEDDEKIREVFCRVVMYLGYNVRSASSFSVARDEINNQTPDLLLTDWDLGMYEPSNGVDVAKLSLSVNPYTKVIMITGNDVDRLKNETQSLSIRAYLRKPVDLSDLQSVIIDALT